MIESCIQDSVLEEDKNDESQNYCNSKSKGWCR